MAKRKRKKKKESKDELEERRAKVEALKVEAKSFGVFITSEKLSEVASIVARIRKSREGKPPCYWRNYDKTARECRICEVRHDCARGEEVPTEIPSDELRPMTCRKCGTGTLSVELRDKASGEVRNYGCSTEECTGNLADQQRHVEAAAAPAKKRPPKPKKPKGKFGTPAPRKPPAELEHALTEFIRTHPGCTTRTAYEQVPGSAARKQIAIKKLEADGVLRRERVGRQIRFHLVEK